MDVRQESRSRFFRLAAWGTMHLLATTSLALPADSARAAEPSVSEGAEADLSGSEAGDVDEVWDAKAILERYRQGLAGVASYDLHITQTVTLPMKAIIKEAEKPAQPAGVLLAQAWAKKPGTRWVPLEAGEKPLSQTNRVRQVWFRDGRRRDEWQFSVPPRSLFVADDGTRLRFLSTVAGHTAVSERQSGHYLPITERDYRYFLRGAVEFHIALDALLQQRPVVVFPSEFGEEDLVCVALPPTEGASLRDSEVRVWFDKRHGFLPRRVELWHLAVDGAEPGLRSRMETLCFHEPQPGAWAPTKMRLTRFNLRPDEYYGEAINVIDLEVDVAKSRWNVELPEELFALPLPEGSDE